MGITSTYYRWHDKDFIFSVFMVLIAEKSCGFIKGVKKINGFVRVMLQGRPSPNTTCCPPALRYVRWLILHKQRITYDSKRDANDASSKLLMSAFIRVRTRMPATSFFFFCISSSKLNPINYPASDVLLKHLVGM